MKKAVKFLIFVPVLLSCVFYSKNMFFYENFKDYENVTFCYVCSNSYINKNKQISSQVFANLKTIKTSNKTFLYFNKIKKQSFLNVDYMQVSFKGNDKSLKKIIKDFNLNLVNFESFENYKVYYFYSPFLKKYKMLNAKKINFQIVIKCNNFTVGYPMIYGSY
jgi:hypothetical protein